MKRTFVSLHPDHTFFYTPVPVKNPKYFKLIFLKDDLYFELNIIVFFRSTFWLIYASDIQYIVNFLFLSQLQIFIRFTKIKKWKTISFVFIFEVILLKRVKDPSYWPVFLCDMLVCKPRVFRFGEVVYHDGFSRAARSDSPSLQLPVQQNRAGGPRGRDLCRGGLLHGDLQWESQRPAGPQGVRMCSFWCPLKHGATNKLFWFEEHLIHHSGFMYAHIKDKEAGFSPFFPVEVDRPWEWGNTMF